MANIVAIVETPRTTAFTTVARLKARLGINTTTPEQDDVLQQRIDEATSAIEAYCGRSFARQTVTELLDGFGRNTMMLNLTPLVALGDVTFQGTVVNEAYSISNADAGFVYKGTPAWYNTQPVFNGITADQMPDQGAMEYAFTYTGGYLMPGDVISASGTLSALAADGSFNLTGDTFPILASGERIRVRGFTSPSNGGTFRVLSRTESKLVVSAALLDETAAVATVTPLTGMIPPVLEGYCITVVKQRRFDDARDGTLTSEKIGDWAGAYADRFDSEQTSNGGLPPDVSQGLDAGGFARIY